MSEKKVLSRRKFLQLTGVVTGAAATLGMPAVAVPAQADAGAHAHTASAGNPLSRGRMFFTNKLEFDTLSDAAERIFPRDETGPGAKDLAVPYFIDNQLAGGYGYNAREYIGGPHYPGEATQGYQTALLRRDVFKQGLIAINRTSQERFSKNFPELDGSQQDQILKDFEAGKIQTEGFTSDYFFSLLRSAVLAGAYADPMYNGNANMDGWRMKQYPGAQMSYIYLMTNEDFEVVEPISLSSMQQ